MNGFPSDDYDPDYFDKPPSLAERICVRDRTLITDFDEYTFRTPRAGLFAGDWVLPYPNINPIRQFRFHLDICGSTSASSGGSAFLEHLPRELLHQILSLLEPCSVVAFAGTSVVCRRAVLSLQCFEAVANCPRLLGTILYLRCRFFTFAQLASCISDTRCRQWNCRHYGDVLYLVTGCRLCYDHWCIGWTPGIVQSQLEEEALAADIPHICVLPGYYGSLGEGVCSQPRYAFDSYALADKFDYRGKGVAYGNGNEPPLMSFVAALQMPYYNGLSDS
ncbi:hypothetical protein NKR19_g3620 [Coniochaeta hoffmannii]|uniref:F-box domain-containing protein n=1 Tax=Coniochaeta hoffmannii TaxID=91930 RepID=A0AA38RU40_9PEZI|nr:hypothetical protein NKR19_g3620 [Coniochaeta hoffmannii]